MEVHPPDHPVMTWKQFFVHMAIVVLGLLIAIGLEQTVEALHRRHQRHQLVEDLRDEAGTNIRVIDQNIADLQHKLPLYQSALTLIAQAPVRDGYATIDLSGPLSNINGDIPATSNGVWTTAKAAGLVPLLPAKLARVYDGVDYNATEEHKAMDDLVTAARRFYRTFLGTEVPGHPYQVRLSVEQRDAFFRETQAFLSAQQWEEIRLGMLRTADDAIVHGVKSEDEMLRFVDASQRR